MHQCRCRQCHGEGHGLLDVIGGTQGGPSCYGEPCAQHHVPLPPGEASRDGLSHDVSHCISLCVLFRSVWVTLLEGLPVPCHWQMDSWSGCTMPMSKWSPLASGHQQNRVGWEKTRHWHQEETQGVRGVPSGSRTEDRCMCHSWATTPAKRSSRDRCSPCRSLHIAQKTVSNGQASCIEHQGNTSEEGFRQEDKISSSGATSCVKLCGAASCVQLCAASSAQRLCTILAATVCFCSPHLWTISRLSSAQAFVASTSGHTQTPLTSSCINISGNAHMQQPLTSGNCINICDASLVDSHG